MPQRPEIRYLRDRGAARNVSRRSVASKTRAVVEDTVGGFLEAIIGFARASGLRASAFRFSDREGVRAFGEAAVESITGLLPKPMQGLWKQGLHYRVRNLARA